jgi:ATP-dependent Lon protease
MGMMWLLMKLCMVLWMFFYVVSRSVAMTGEITLRGRALEIGGLKSKILAAHRAGIKTVIIPEENKKNLEDVPEFVLKDIKVIPVSNIDEVLKIALVKPKKRTS